MPIPRIQALWLLASCCLSVASNAQQAETVLVHGTVLTVDANDSIAQALAIRDGHIIAVGTDAAIMKLTGPETRVIDLHGRTATPGMIDTHSHYAEAGPEDLYLLKLDDATSLGDIVGRLKQRVASAKPGEWVRGRGWDEGKLAEKRYPTATDLDAVSPDNPVLLVNTTGHYASVNTSALHLAKIDDTTRNPENGTIERDAAGHATGVLKEGARDLITPLIPQFSQQQIEQGILKEIGDLHREGVTSFKDTASRAQWDAFQHLNQQGKLQERVCMLWRTGDTVASAVQTIHDLQEASPEPRIYRQNRLAACGVKIFMDGSAISRTAWSYEPWIKNGTPDPGNTGYPLVKPEVYRQMVLLFHNAGLSIGTHAIGDRAIDTVVDAYAEAERQKPTPGLRHSIIHAYLPTPHAIDVMAALQKEDDAGYPEVQPVFLWWLGKSMPSSFGPERLARTMPLKTYLDHHVRWSAGTDYGVAPLAPRFGLWASVEREAVGGAHPFGTSQAVDVHTALRSYTAWAAPMLFLENQIGTLEAGKFADIAVWDRDPYMIPATELKNLQCEMTILAGKVVYSR